MNPTWRNHAEGVLWGQAVGDALGLATEFLSAEDARALYPNGVSGYAGFVQDEHRSRWKEGEWTDDTDQMICVLSTLYARGAADPTDLGRRIQEWVHSGGQGVGAHTWRVIHWYGYAEDPVAAAEECWRVNGRRAAANGAVMRTSGVGLWDSHDLDQVATNADLLARATHADPASVAAAVTVSVAIAHLLHHPGDVAGALAEATPRAARIHADVTHHIQRGIDAPDFASLKLDENVYERHNAIGWAYTTLPAGIHALTHAQDWLSSIQALVMAGGDADTNAAVAGALLGARFGRDGIPEALRTGLRRFSDFQTLTEKFLRRVEERTASSAPPATI